MIFTAFDFETCNGSGLSAVELGVAVFDDAKLLECRSWRFYPINDHFHHQNVKVNAISKEHVLGLSRFNDLWHQMEPYFKNPLVAHNVSFDARVLCSTLDELGIPRPESHAYCTCDWSRASFDFEDYKLSTICNELRIPLQHHVAVADATAAGHLLNRIVGTQSLSEGFQNSPSSCWIPDWTMNATETDWSSVDYAEDTGSWTMSGASVSITAEELMQHAEPANNSEPEFNKLQKSACEFSDVVCNCDNPQLLAGWRVGITGDTLIGKKELISLLKMVGAAGEVKGAVLRRAKEGVDYCPTNVLVVAEEMMSEIAQGRKITGKIASFGKMRFGKKPAIVKIISEQKLYDIVVCSLKAGNKHLSQIDYDEDEPAIISIWDQVKD
jgi:DNA polymerase III subunit epsilon